MEHTNRALTALMFAGLAFATLFHALVLRQVYPGQEGQFHWLPPVLAGLFALGLSEAWNGKPRTAPLLALGFIAAVAYGLRLALGDAALVGGFLLSCSALGLLFLSRSYLTHPGTDIPSGHREPRLLNPAGGEIQKTAQLRKAR